MITPPAVSFKRPEAGPSKTLTPQRKHRKLLKDGSGTEVWPERIEKVFVQGTRRWPRPRLCPTHVAQVSENTGTPRLQPTRVVAVDIATSFS